MNGMVVSADAFRWIITALTLAGSLWALFDIVKLARVRGDSRDPLVRDQRFGYLTGIVIGAFGISGVLHFHGVF